MSTVTAGAEQRMILSDVSWATFRGFLTDLGDSRGKRLAYNDGTLEIKAPSFDHEHSKSLLGRFVEVLTEELDIEIMSAGSVSLLRDDLQKAVEPDESFYIGDVASIRHRRKVDLATDRPPDLAIEIDISRSSRRRQGIYARLGIPEVWRYDGRKLQVLRLRGDRYLAAKRSSVLPQMPISLVVRLLRRSSRVNETQLVRDFRRWVREHLAGD